MQIACACLFACFAASALAQTGAKRDEPAKLGACVRQFDGLGEPTGVAFGPDGSLYICESLAQRVNAFDPQGLPLKSFGLPDFGDPRDVAVSENGTLVVSLAGREELFVYAPDGKLSTIGERGSGPGQFNGIEGVAVVGDSIAVADSRNDRIQLFMLGPTSVRFERSIGERGSRDGALNHPADVAFAPDGSIFVADLFNQRVQQFSRQGKFLRSFGTPGPNPGQFGGPTGLSMHGGFVHVVDRDNSRVQVFTLNGELHSWYGIHALRPREGNGKLHYPLRIALNADGTRAAIVEPMENRVQLLGPVDPNVEELPPLPALPPSHYGGAIDADGPFLVVTEPSIPKVLLFQMLDGEPIEFGAFGTYGARTGQLIWPTDVAVDFARRRIFVADSGSARILEYEFRFDPKAEIGFDPERVRFVAEFDLAHAPWALSDSGAQLVVEPAGIWRDGQGGLCIADPRNRIVWCIDSSWVNVIRHKWPAGWHEIVDGTAGPRQAAAGKEHEQYVVDRLGGRVFALTSQKPIAEGLSRPSAALFTAGGALYISDGGANALLRPGREKAVLARGPGLGSNELMHPRGLAELAGGRVVVLDWGNHRGMIFDRDDKFVRAFGSQLFIRPTFAERVAKAAEPALKVADVPRPAQFPTLDGTQAWHAANRLVSNDGRFAVFWRPTPDPIQERQGFSLEVWVTKLATPNVLETDLGLSLDAAMPEHGHGMNVNPKTTRAADGHFLIEGTRLHMPGRWEMYFDISRAGRTERAQLALELE